MKKLTKTVLVTTIASLLLVACAPAAQPAPAPAGGDTADANGGADGGFEFVLVVDGMVDDRSFNQSSWEGLVAFAEARDIPHTFFQTAGQSTGDYLNAIDLGVNAGATLIVAPGFQYQEALYIAQDIFADTHFVLLDAVPQMYGNQRIEDNVIAILYAEEQSGFLAGYSVVMEGHRSLGFMGGMAVPAVVSFGYGFLQGAEHAARVLGLAQGEVTVMYHYTGGFSPSPEIQALAASWYTLAGVEVIFAAAGGGGASVFAAAETNNGLVIGVDTDQSMDSPTVITSAIKELGNSVYAAIEDFYNGTWRGGQVVRFDASNNGVGLPMETSRFVNFTVEQYENIFAQLADHSVTVIYDHNLTTDDLGLELIEVTHVN